MSRSQLDDALIQIKTGAAARGQQHSAGADGHARTADAPTPDPGAIAPGQGHRRRQSHGQGAGSEALADLKKHAGSDEAFATRLKTIGITESELTTKMGEELTAEAVLKRELKVGVTDDEVKKFYDENPGKFEQPEMVRAATS